jgi:hypothetical protein
MHMLRISLLCLLLAPASAGLSAFFELLTYDIKASMAPLPSGISYAAISLKTAVAVCDWSDGGVMKTPAVCGATCKLLGSTVDASAYALSPSDHLQMVGMKVSSLTNLAFRGTYVWDVVNNRRNTQIALHPTSLCTTCAVHRGFWRNFVALKSMVSSVVTGLGNKEVSTYGHSMGSAMSQLAALYLAVTGQTVTGISALGAVRLGNQALVQLLSTFDVGVFNVITDPVPHFPPRMYGYRATGPIFAIFIDPIYWASLSAGDDVSSDGAVFYTKFEGASADYKMSIASPYLVSSSHMDYFIGLAPEYLITCGGMADRFVKNTNAVSLFD